jgi:hypothetical protein
MSFRPFITEPFDLAHNDGALYVAIRESLRDRQWAAYSGPIQRALQTREWRGMDVGALSIDFKKCTWADPLPLLYLLLIAQRFRDDGGSVRIILPLPTKESGRFLKFLSQEGFLDCFRRIGDTISD